MIGFDETKILNNCQSIYEQRAYIEQIADKVTQKGFDSVLFTSSGGSIAMMQPFYQTMKGMSRLPVYSEVAAELVLTENARITNGSIAFLASKSGDTKETVAAAKWLQEKGVTIISVVGEENSPLEAISKYTVVYGAGRPQELVFYLLIGRILYNNGEFDDYPEFAEELKNMGKMLVSVSQKADVQAAEYAKKYRDKEYQIWIGSGSLEGPTYSFAMCTLEECQWLRTKFVTSPEFFHGTLELVDKGVLVALTMGEGETRILDERVKRFAEQYTDQLVVFDTKDYATEGFSDKYRKFLSPVMMNAILARVAKHYEKERDHSLEIRRYYRKMEY